MTTGIFSGLARMRFTVGYVGVLLLVSGAIALLGPHAHDVLVQHASTNLHNLAHGHLMTLLDSAFVVDAGPMYFWMPFLRLSRINFEAPSDLRDQVWMPAQFTLCDARGGAAARFLQVSPLGRAVAANKVGQDVNGVALACP